MKYLSKLKSHNKLFEFIKFGVVGGIATVLHYAIYFVLQALTVQYNIAYTIGYFLSFIFNFFASNYFTFNTKPNANKGFRFLLAHVFNYLLQIALLNLYIYVGISKSIAPIFVFVVSIPVNFVLVKIALKSKNQ